MIKFSSNVTSDICISISVEKIVALKVLLVSIEVFVQILKKQRFNEYEPRSTEEIGIAKCKALRKWMPQAKAYISCQRSISSVVETQSMRRQGLITSI